LKKRGYWGGEYEKACYQNTAFSIDHYCDIGHVANLLHDNGGNSMNMTLTNDAVWQVTGDSAARNQKSGKIPLTR